MSPSAALLRVASTLVLIALLLTTKPATATATASILNPSSLTARAAIAQDDSQLNGASARLSGVVQIAVASSHVCAVLEDGRLVCWGDNRFGQLGDLSPERSRERPVEVWTLPDSVIAVDVAQYRTCAVTVKGAVYCWGAHSNAAAIDPAVDGLFSAMPRLVRGLESGYKSVAMGEEFDCALSVAGGVKCWGWGVVGDGTFHFQVEPTGPVQVSGLTSGVRSLSVGEFNACAVLTSGGLRCWGRNYQGFLFSPEWSSGEGNPLTPVEKPGLPAGIRSVATIYLSTCIATESGAVRCWGSGEEGRLGNGHYGIGGPSWDLVEPVDVEGVLSVTMGSHVCALTEAGRVWCWGRNGAGQLGRGTASNRLSDSVYPKETLEIGAKVVAIDAGGANTCVLTEAGEVLCFGLNEGRIGDGSWGFVPAPIQIATLPAAVKHASAGWWTQCAVTVADAVYCWGENIGNLFGDNTVGKSWQPMQPLVVISETVRSISTGEMHACLLYASGAAECWGSNEYGQLGRGDAVGAEQDAQQGGDVRVALDHIRSLDSMGRNTCAVTDAGAVYCWGRNLAGILGAAEPEASGVPTLIPGLASGVKEVRVGRFSIAWEFACALLQSGGVKCLT